jgi:hypothetical protein
MVVAIKVQSTVFIVVYGFMCFIFISDSSLVGYVMPSNVPVERLPETLQQHKAVLVNPLHPNCVRPAWA